MFTFWDVSWGSRPLDAADVGVAVPHNDEEQGLMGATNGANGGYGTLNAEDMGGDAVPSEDVNGGDAALGKDAS